MLPTGCCCAVDDEGDEAIEENADAVRKKRRLAVTNVVSADAMEGMVATCAL